MRHRAVASRTSPGESSRTAPNAPTGLVVATEPRHIESPFTFGNDGIPYLTLQLADPPIPGQDPETNSSLIGGAMVEFDNGDRKRIEDIRAEDLISTAERSTDLRMTEAVTCAITPRFLPPRPDHPSRNVALLLVSFSYDNAQLQSEIETSIEYPFFVTTASKGWASFDPERTYRMYNLRCTQLQVGDVFLALLPRHQPAPPPMVRGDVPPDAGAENGTADSDSELDPGGSEYPTPSELANAASQQRQLRSPDPEPPIVPRPQQEPKKPRKSRPSKQKQPAGGPPMPRTLPPPPPQPKPAQPYPPQPTVKRQHKAEAFITIEDDEPPMHVVTKKGAGGLRINPSSPRPVAGPDGNNWESPGKRRQEHQLRRPIAKRKPTATVVNHQQQQQPQPKHPTFLDVAGREPRTLNIYQRPTTKLCPSQQQQQPHFPSSHATTSNGQHGQMARTNGDTYSDSE